jgi:hypothetical protein
MPDGTDGADTHTYPAAIGAGMGEEMEVSRRKEAIVLWRIRYRCVSGLQVLLTGID